MSTCRAECVVERDDAARRRYPETQRLEILGWHTGQVPAPSTHRDLRLRQCSARNSLFTNPIAVRIARNFPAVSTAAICAKAATAPKATVVACVHLFRRKSCSSRMTAPGNEFATLRHRSNSSAEQIQCFRSTPACFAAAIRRCSTSRTDDRFNACTCACVPSPRSMTTVSRSEGSMKLRKTSSCAASIRARWMSRA